MLMNVLVRVMLIDCERADPVLEVRCRTLPYYVVLPHALHEVFQRVFPTMGDEPNRDLAILLIPVLISRDQFHEAATVTTTRRVRSNSAVRCGGRG